MLKRSTKVRVKSFDAIVINGTGDLDTGEEAYRVSIKDPYTGKHAFWTVIPVQLIEVIEDE